MASATPMSSALFLLLATLVNGASAATFTIKNNCGYTVWPAGIPIGGGVQLNSGQTWTVNVAQGTSGRFWGRTGCSFSGDSGHCDSGDCNGKLTCTVSGQSPVTLAEYTIGTGNNQDYYDISCVDGYNLPMAFSCRTGDSLDTCQYSSDDSKTHACSTNSNYQITFCP